MSRKPVLLPITRRDSLMGTVVLQHAHGINAGRALEEVTAEIRRLENLWSFFTDSSEIARLNRSAGRRPVSVSPDTTRIVTSGKELCRRSSGAFDITLGPLIRLWRDALALGAPPEGPAIDAAFALKGNCEIAVSPERSLYLPREGQSVDLGAIGKGFAADRACDLYRDAGVRSAFISLGGNVSVVGRKPDGRPWSVGIRNPSGGREECIGCLEAEDCSVVTSGAYERFTECRGKRYHHIIDPATGRPSESDLASATVISRSSTVADALSTAAFVLGLERGMRLIESIEGIWAVLINARGVVHVTGDKERSFHRT
jgi:thiamine biosynthesis lipoprotein